jgi:hypothetical protein
MADLYARLSASKRLTVHHTVDLTATEREILANPGLDSTGRFRVGVNRPVDRSVSNRTGDLVVRVPGAAAIRLEMTNVEGKVAVFNDSGEAYEYDADGFTHALSGDAVTVRGSARVRGAGAVNLGGNLCDFNASCTENAECVSVPPAIDGARDAIAMILFFSRGFYYLCSGGLVADSDSGSEIPYFLTANHCVSKGREAQSVLTYFDHVQTSCAGGACSFPSQADTSGSTIAATDSTGDYTLLVLDQTPPAGRVFLGWNTAPVAFTNGVNLYRISHPGGAPQAYSAHSVDTTVATCGVWPRGGWIYSQDTFGATEGGSSGSPVLNAAAEIVGQLSGACGFNVYDECDAINNSTVDGAFASYYPQLAALLGSGSGGCSADADCDDGIACTVDTCEASTGQCLSDGSGCPVCTPQGESCSADSECCSGKCRGRSGSAICR